MRTQELENELLSIGKRAGQMEERISNREDRNLEMMHREKERDLGIKRMKDLYENYLRHPKPMERARSSNPKSNQNLITSIPDSLLQGTLY